MRHNPVRLTLAHSPDPDDVFMWWPITGMIDPPQDPQAIVPSRVITPPIIDTAPFVFEPVAADIAALNRRAIARADLDITALSVFAYAKVSDRYRLTAFAGSFGEGYGPRIVARPDAPKIPIDDRPHRLPIGDHIVIAVPGVETSAFLLLSLLLGPGMFRFVEMPFDHILSAVQSGERGVTHGLLIHQSQLVFSQLGLELILDLGAHWLDITGLPLPLGGNAVRRDLDHRCGPGATTRVVNLLDASLRHAHHDRDRSLDYARRFAPELDRAATDRYLNMYVSPLTLDCGDRGQQAIEELLRRAQTHALITPQPPLDLLRPTSH